ncbi:MAG: hypothetical protein KKG04_09590 [Candidatus Thermoplasmatota archaeon]|nr:hypothetical protein [Candidatus Thermoplasmatota archaeon]
MNWKKVVGAVILILAFIGLLVNGVYRGPWYFVFYLVLFFIAMGGVWLFLMGMADLRHTVYRFRGSGDIAGLERAVTRCVERMRLVVKSREVSEKSLRFEVSEGLWTLVWYWPVHFDVEATVESGYLLVNIRCWYGIYSVLERRHADRKYTEFIDILKTNVMLEEV